MSRYRGRHRKVLLTRRAAGPPLLAASGTMAAAALTAVVLSGQDAAQDAGDLPSDGSGSSLAEARDPGLLADPLLLAGLSLDEPGALGSSRSVAGLAGGLDQQLADLLAQAAACAWSASQPGTTGSLQAALPLPGGSAAGTVLPAASGRGPALPP